MTKRINIEESLTCYKNILKRNESSFKMATIYGILRYPRTGKETERFHKFLIDTGASISILNKEFIKFIDDDFKEVDHTTVQYGGKKATLPVYEMILTLKDHDFPMVMAFDRNLELPSLLGQFDFLNKFNHVIFDYTRSISKLIKYP